MTKKKIIVLGPEIYGEWIENSEILPENTPYNEIDLLVFTGGGDVAPTVYGERKHKSTSGISHQRDLYEIQCYNKAIEEEIPILGICRGSQLLCALQDNGKLIQNTNGHAITGTHSIVSFDLNTIGEIIDITSTHHQMAYPFDIEKHVILASSKNKLSKKYEGGKENYNVISEPEIVYYKKTNCLGIQGHPEYMDSDSPAVKYCNYLIKKYLFNQIYINVKL